MALQAQDMKALQTDALRMYKNTTAGKYEALLADTYPKIFELVPKEKMLEVLKSTSLKERLCTGYTGHSAQL
jgi:spore cortex formation protein SpoVR/YcgB (stage V sporulation)